MWSAGNAYLGGYVAGLAASGGDAYEGEPRLQSQIMG